MVGLVLVTLLGADAELAPAAPLEQLSCSDLTMARLEAERSRPNTAGWVTGALFGGAFSLASLSIVGAFAIGGTGDVSSTIFLIGAPMLAIAAGAIPLFVVSLVRLFQGLAENAAADAREEQIDRELARRR